MLWQLSSIFSVSSERPSTPDDSPWWPQMTRTALSVQGLEFLFVVDVSIAQSHLAQLLPLSFEFVHSVWRIWIHRGGKKTRGKHVPQKALPSRCDFGVLIQLFSLRPFFGCCPAGCHTDLDAFSCCSKDHSLMILGHCTAPWDHSERWRRKKKKKRDDVFMDGLRPKSFRVMLSDSLLRIYSQSWGSAVDALNITYPSPLPVHRVLLTVVFVPSLMLWLQLQLVA